MIYKYDKEGYLLGSYKANEDGTIPKGFTDVMPNGTIEGQIAKFDTTSKTWSIETSYKALVYYNVSNGSKYINPKHSSPDSSIYTTEEPNVEGNFLSFKDGVWTNDEELEAERLEEGKANARAKALKDNLAIHIGDKVFGFNDVLEVVIASTLLDTLPKGHVDIKVGGVDINKTDLKEIISRFKEGLRFEPTNED